MDKEQQVRDIVYRFLKDRVDKHERNPRQSSIQFPYNEIERHAMGKLEIGSRVSHLDYETHAFNLLHVCINELLTDRILMQMFKLGHLENTTFRITPYGVKCIQEGHFEPAKPTLNTMFDSLELHPWVLVASGKLFKDGYYDLAIFEACKMINNKTKDKIKDEPNRPQGKDGKALDGADLMRKVFKPKDPFLTFPPETPSAENEQEGFMNLFVGAWQALRNPKAHETPINRNPYETLHYLSFVSILAHKIEKSEVTDNGDTST